MTQEEWDEWMEGDDERSRRLYERAKRGEEERKARERAEVETASRPKRRRLFGLLSL
jgi:hypothetical protein